MTLKTSPAQAISCAIDGFVQRGDYMEHADVAKEDVDEIFPKAIDFVNRIKKYLLKEK